MYLKDLFLEQVFIKESFLACKMQPQIKTIIFIMYEVILLWLLDHHCTIFHSQKYKNIMQMRALFLIRYVCEAAKLLYQGVYSSGHLRE